MVRIGTYLTIVCSLFVVAPAVGQEADVVDANPFPARTDQPVTIFLNADQGTGGLEGHDGEVYAHTGISTDQNPDEAWKCVKNDWPTSDSFDGNRDDTQLTQVSTNRYKLEIDDIRAYYKNTSTSCDLGDDEKIQTMNMVFRNADGSKEGKAEGGEDIFVEVNDVGDEPFLEANILNPSANPPLYPYMTSTDTTVNVTVTADTANVDSFSELRLFVDGNEVKSTTSDSLTHPLKTGQNPNRFQIRAEAEATTGDSTLQDVLETFVIRTPNVVDEARPSGVEDGINYNDDGSITLSLFASEKNFVYAIGDFSNWEIDNQYFMKREKTAEGVHWWVTIDGLSANQQYDFQYFVDGDIRTSDPLAHKIRTPADAGISEDIYPGLQSYPGDETENFVSVIRPGRQQDEFDFSDFDPPEREDLVIYELLVRDFVEESSFRVLKDTLAYLDRLGVNAVELMPVANFGSNNSWGYNPNAHLALDKSYGPPEDFKKFVEEAHSRGIAVIMDVVYNHITNQSPLAQLYSSPSENPFLVASEDDRGFCDDFFRELNQESPFIQRYIDRANEYWIEEFNVDGFRFDLAKCVAADINDPNYSDAIVSGWKDVSDHVWDTVDPNTYMILEFFGSPSVENELGGYRDDETGGMMTWHNMNPPHSQVDMGYQENSSLSNSYYGNRGEYDQPSFIAYMESHDEQWLMRKKKAFGNSSGEYSTKDFETALNRQKLVGALYFTIPGPRMTWQFSELGYGWGENECLKDDGDGGTCPASAPGRTAPKPIRWEYRDSEQHPERVELYKAWSALIDLRNRTDVFTSTQTAVRTKMGGQDLTRRIVLEHDSMNAVVIANADLESREISADFPSSGTWYDYFTGTEVTVTEADVPTEDETGTPISLAPGEFHIMTSEPVDFPEPGLVPFESAAPPPVAPSDVEAKTGTEEITVSWSASSSSDLTGYAVYRGQSADFDTSGARIARLDAEATSYADSDVASGQIYYYRLVALDVNGARSVLTPSAQALIYPQTLSFDVSRSFGQADEPQGYRLVALPGQVDRALGQTLSGEAGDAWQAYWDDGTESDFFLQFDESETFTFKPGQGFWLISDTSWTVQNQGVSTVSLEEGQVTTIDVHSGWNIISNPFDWGVSWDRVQEVNQGNLQPLWSFRGSFTRTSRFSSAQSGEAYYFRNSQDLDQLTIPYEPGAAASRIEGGKKTSQGDVTTVALEVGRDGQWNSAVQVGWGADSEAGLDPSDWIAPPNRFASLSLRARPESAPSSRRQLLARSVRPRPDRGQSFALTLQSSTMDPVNVRGTGLEAFADQEIQLVSEETGASFDLREQSSVQIEPRAETTDLTLLIGTKSYVQNKTEELTASELVLRSGHPNPFRQKTTLSYTLPEDGPVKFEIFDVLGRRVRVLVDERQETGPHQVTWNGGNRSGQTVASGVYLGRLSFGGNTVTQKLVLVK